MRKLAIALILTLGIFSQAQTPGTCGSIVCSQSNVISQNGGSFTVPSSGALTASFEEIPAGAPSTLSVTIRGCGTSGTCTLLDVYSTVASTIRTPTIAVAYAYYKVQAVWTGGTAPSVTINTRQTSAPIPPSGGAVLTCDAAAVANYAPALCIFTLSNADILQFDGTLATGIEVISAPGSNRQTIIQPFSSSAYAVPGTNINLSIGQLQGNYFLSSPYGNFGFVAVTSLSTTNNASLFSSANFGTYFPSSTFGTVNQPFYVSSNYIPAAFGRYTSSTLVSGGIADGANTTQITSGNAGVLYTAGDTFWVTGCSGNTFLVDTVDGGTGAVLTYHQTAIAAGCSVGNGQATSGGTGSGLQLDVLTIGAGYRVGDTFTDDTFNGLAGHIVTVDSNGLILTYAIDNPGAGGSVENPDPLGPAGSQPGIGMGASIHPTITPGNGHAVLSISFVVVPAA